MKPLSTSCSAALSRGKKKIPFFCVITRNNTDRHTVDDDIQSIVMIFGAGDNECPLSSQVCLLSGSSSLLSHHA